MSSSLARRGGLSVNPLVFLLVLVLVGVFIWRGFLILDLMERMGVLKPGARAGIYIGLALLPAIWCAIAGAVGVGLYFITGRSDGAANAGISLVLVLAIGFYGYGTIVLSTQPLPAVTTVAAPKPLSQQVHEEMQEQMEAMRKGQQQQLDRMRERMNNPATIPIPQPPANPPRNTEAPAAQPQADVPRAAPPTNPTPADAESERKAKAALEPLRTELRSKLDGFLSAADPVVASMAKTPRALRSDLEKRVTDTGAMKQKAVELEAYLRGLDERIDAALEKAGVDLGTRIREKIEFGRAADAFGRANAVTGYKRIFDAGMEEAAALRDNAGKWRTDSAGMATSSDTSLNFTLRRLHEGVQTQLRGAADFRSALAKP